MKYRSIILMSFMVMSAGHAAQVEIEKNASANFENDLQNKARLLEGITSELQRNAASLERAAETSRVEEAEPDIEDSQQFLINNIVVDTGDEEFYHLDIRPTLQPYLGKKMGRRDIFLLIKDANNYFASRGFVTTAVTLSPANLKQGTLKLKVHWGRIEGVLINGSAAANYQQRILLSQALPGVQGRILNMHDIDQSVENLNNYASSAKIDILPAAKSGYSYLNVILGESQTPAFNFSIDNSGQGTSPKDGLYRYSMGYSVSNLLLGIDTLALRLNTRHVADDGGRYNYYAGLNYDVPMGYTNLGVQASTSKNGQPIQGEYASYSSKTDGQTYGIRLTQVLLRDKTDKFSGFGELQRRRNKNYINGVMTSVNSYPYTDLNTGVQYTTSLAGGSLYSDLTYSRGLAIFEGKEGGYNKDNEPINYQKLAFNLAWSRNFALLEQPLQFSSRMSGQYSEDKMLDTYKMVVGDEYTVRGYKDTSYYGDRGAVITNTLSFPLDPLAGINLSPFIGLDMSWLENIDSPYSWVSGSALGVKGEYRRFNSSLTFGLPLGHQSTPAKPTDPWVFYFNAAISL